MPASGSARVTTGSTSDSEVAGRAVRVSATYCATGEPVELLREHDQQDDAEHELRQGDGDERHRREQPGRDGCPRGGPRRSAATPAMPTAVNWVSASSSSEVGMRSRNVTVTTSPVRYDTPRSPCTARPSQMPKRIGNGSSRRRSRSTVASASGVRSRSEDGRRCASGQQLEQQVGRHRHREEHHGQRDQTAPQPPPRHGTRSGGERHGP